MFIIIRTFAVSVIHCANIERYLQSLRLYYWKVFVTILLAVPVNISAQPETIFRKDVHSSLGYLMKDTVLKRQVVIRQNGVTVFAANEKGLLATRPETTVYWTEWNYLGRYLASLPLADALVFYKIKGQTDQSAELLRKIKGDDRPPGTVDSRLPLKGWRIALDPGHFAHNFETAKIEKKYVRLRASDMGTAEDILLYEARLTAITADILRSMLEGLGATVLVTRTETTSATGKNFDDWYREDLEKDLEQDRKDRLIDSLEHAQTAALIRENRDAGKTRHRILHTFFKDHEFRARSEKINSFRPHLTLILHYNVDENNVPDKEGYHKPHSKNFSMVFVGGAYTKGELVQPADRMLFLRHLLSDDIAHSVAFSALVQKHITAGMHVPAYTGDFLLKYIRNYSLAAEGNPGVYHRNLFLTRAVYGTLAFAEPLLQDNREEALLLSVNDCDWHGKKVPCRLIEMAEAYKKAVLEYAGATTR